MFSKLSAASLALTIVVGTAAALGPSAAANADADSAAQTMTYMVRLEAYYVGTRVAASSPITINASSELDFRNQVGTLQAAYARELNNSRPPIRWNRITFVLLSVN